MEAQAQVVRHVTLTSKISMLVVKDLLDGNDVGLNME